MCSTILQVGLLGAILVQRRGQVHGYLNKKTPAFAGRRRKTIGTVG